MLSTAVTIIGRWQPSCRLHSMDTEDMDIHGGLVVDIYLTLLLVYESTTKAPPNFKVCWLSST